MIKPETRAFAREGRRTADYSLFDWLHGYVYSRWPYFYIAVGTGMHPLSRMLSPLAQKIIERFSSKTRRSLPTESDSVKTGFNLDSGTIADNYHGKVLTTEAARELVTIKTEVNLTVSEKVVPYSHVRDIILQNPDHIVALDCPCRAGRDNPCLPLDVCLIVGEPFAGFVAEHHPKRSRWIDSSEVLDILQAEHERGHVHHAFFKDAMLNRFYAICNCCSCCCGAFQAWKRGTPMLAPSGYVSFVDEARCEGCGDCIEACPFKAIRKDGKFARVDRFLCMGCGVCLRACEKHAHRLVLEPSKGEPLEIRDLLAGT